MVPFTDTAPGSPLPPKKAGLRTHPQSKTVRNKMGAQAEGSEQALVHECLNMGTTTVLQASWELAGL